MISLNIEYRNKNECVCVLIYEKKGKSGHSSDNSSTLLNSGAIIIYKEGLVIYLVRIIYPYSQKKRHSVYLIQKYSLWFPFFVVVDMSKLLIK